MASAIRNAGVPGGSESARRSAASASWRHLESGYAHRKPSPRPFSSPGATGKFLHARPDGWLRMSNSRSPARVPGSERHIAQIRSKGRMAWQASTGHNRCSRIETQIGRWKSVIGPRLQSRSVSRQITEIQPS